MADERKKFLAIQERRYKAGLKGFAGAVKRWNKRPGVERIVGPVHQRITTGGPARTPKKRPEAALLKMFRDEGGKG